MSERIRYPNPEEKLKAAEERLRRAEQRRAKERRSVARLKRQASENARKADTRRKILVGALVLEFVDWMEEDGVLDWPRWLDGLLREKLVRDDDRALFGLAPRPAEPAPASAGREQLTPAPFQVSSPMDDPSLWDPLQR